MQKQFLYNIILASTLGFSAQNAYAAAAGTSADTAGVDQAERFSALRKQIEAYHPEHSSKFLWDLYNEHKKEIVAKGEEPSKDRFLGNIRTILQGLVVEGDISVLYEFADELKSLGDEELALELYAAVYRGTSDEQPYEDLRKQLIVKLASTGAIGKRLAPVLQAARHTDDELYNNLVPAVKDDNFIALYGLQYARLLHNNTSTGYSFMGIEGKIFGCIVDICRGYVEVSVWPDAFVEWKQLSIPGSVENIKKELARLAFWNTDDADNIAQEAGMVFEDGTMQTGFELNEAYLERALRNSLTRTVAAALAEIKADPDQLVFWKTEVNRVLMYCGSMEDSHWLKALETELDSVPSAASAAFGAGGASAASSTSAAAGAGAS